MASDSAALDSMKDTPELSGPSDSTLSSKPVLEVESVAVAESPATAAQYVSGHGDDLAQVTSSKELVPAATASIFVLSRDLEFVSVVGRAAGQLRYIVHVVDKWSRLLQAAKKGIATVVLLDADLVGRRLGERIAELEGLTSPPIASVAASRDDAEKLIGTVSGRVHRLLIKPAPLGATRLLLDSAVHRSVRLRSLTAAQQESSPAVEAGLTAPSFSRWPYLAVSISGLVVVLAIVSLMRLLPSISPNQAPTDVADPAQGGVVTSNSPIPAPDNDAVVPAAPERADADGGGRPERPVGDSAAAFYTAVFGEGSDSGQTDPQLEALIDSLFTAADAALLEGSLERASDAAARIRLVRPSSVRLSLLQARIEQESAAVVANEPGPGEDQAPDDALANELASLLTIARSRLELGQLTTPQGDSALDYLQRATALEIEDPELQAFGADLGSAIAAAARLELERGGFELAQELVDQAAALNVDGETLALLNLNLATIRHSDLLASGIDRLEGGQLAAPEEDSAFYYLSTLRAENPEFSGLDVAWNGLLAAMEANAERGIELAQWAEAESWVAALEAADADPSRPGELRDRIEFGRLQADYLVNPAAAGELLTLEVGAAQYPEPARVQNIEGWVDLDFIVDVDGIPTNVTVVAAQPPGTFEEAARQAISQYRFAPYSRDGRVYQRRGELRISFTLQ